MSADPKRVEEIFDAAASLDPRERDAFVDRACAGDAALALEVRELLEHDAAGTTDEDAPPAVVDPGAGAHATTVKSDRADRRARRAKSDPEASPARAANDQDSTKDPAVVGRFEVIAKLGEGGMGAVYDAYDARLDRKVAVKVMRVGAKTRSARTRLLREAQAMARVAHPNVVTVFEVGAFGDEMYVAMERVDGRTLTSWLAEEPREWRAILAKMTDAARGLAAAHAAGIVHRDFKPDNVLVDREGRVRVLDFGLARARGDLPPDDAPISPAAAGVRARELELTREGTIMGTPSYMSPEHFRGRAVDPKSDQFCFGVALYRALWKTTPFDGATIGELRDNVLAGRAKKQPASDVPEEVAAAILRALAPDPAARFPSMDELVHALEGPLALEPDHDPAHARALRRRLAAAITAAGGIAVAVVFGKAGLRLDEGTVIRQGLGGFLIICALSFALRKRLFVSRYSRNIWLLYIAPAAAFNLHRLMVLPGADLTTTLIGDAIMVGLASAIGAMFLERWLLLNTALALAYVVAAKLLGDRAMIGFPTVLFGTVALGVWFWRDNKGDREKSSDSKNRLSGSGSGPRT